MVAAAERFGPEVRISRERTMGRWRWCTNVRFACTPLSSAASVVQHSVNPVVSLGRGENGQSGRTTACVRVSVFGM